MMLMKENRLSFLVSDMSLLWIINKFLIISDANKDKSVSILCNTIVCCI